MFYLDSTYMIYIVPALLLSLYAQARVKSVYHKYARIYAQSGLTGAQVAERIMRYAGINNVGIERTPGKLTDHYDPTKQMVRFSQDVYASSSLAALGIAAHEVGHVLQHHQGYVPIKIRNSILPVVQIGSTLAIPLFFLGLFMGPSLMDLGILLFGGVVVFHLVTLPVEFDASRRAVAILREGGYLQPSEIQPVKKVLNAAAMTYVAALVMAIAQMLRLMALSNRRR